MAEEIRQGRRGWLGISGVGVRASCLADGLHVDLLHAGAAIDDADRLVAVTIAAPTLSGSLANSAPPGSVSRTENAPVVREVVEDWFRRLGRLTNGHLDARALRRPDTEGSSADCVAANAGIPSPLHRKNRVSAFNR
jgi:hypothetical protein